MIREMQQIKKNRSKYKEQRTQNTFSQTMYKTIEYRMMMIYISLDCFNFLREENEDMRKFKKKTIQ